ncbi:MAG: type II toxin-antitoxin system VapC family toxin [Tepidisphaerales bacterium]
MATPSPNSPSDVLLLDTNVLVIYARAGEPYRRLEAQLGLRTKAVQGLISIITVGEVMAFARKRNWGQSRRTELDELLQTLVAIDVNTPEIVEAYAEIDHYSEKVVKPAHPMGQNDMWIAATAHVLDCELVTTDKDFDHLHGIKLRRRWIDQSSLIADNT